MQIVITADIEDSVDRERAEDVAIGYARMFGIKLKRECEDDCASRASSNPSPVTYFDKDGKSISSLYENATLNRNETIGEDSKCRTVATECEITLLPGQELVDVKGVKMAMYPVGYIPPTPELLYTAAIFGDQSAPVTVAVPAPPSADTTPPPAVVSALTTNAVPPAPLESAPQANVTASNPVTGVELDKDGIPWDARIHSTAKTKNADGSWRLKKGVGKEIVTLVKEELKGLMDAPIAAKPDTPPPVIPPVTEQPIIGAFPAFTRELAPHMRSVTNPEGKLTPEYLNELAKYLGVVNPQGEGMFSMLIHRPDAIPLMRAEIVKAIGEL